ncbi:MAG TPA: argininosuccinate lyase [Candidatus Angelobacter sp.]|jgi:argininosuccinate lyase|nr:argininosuccinate lyase [Candidatus Angelobacter sp.]
MWSGRFRQPLDRQFEQWQRSFPFDQKLLLYELAASRAHAQALGAAGVLSAQEWDRILTGLDDITRRGETQPNFLQDDEAEDVHHFVEKQLTSLIGELGKKLHAGRSRNEQIATDLRLFVREAIDDLHTILLDFLETFLTRAEKVELAVMPAYTHLQRAEPVLVAHWLMSYFQMFSRDLERLQDCRRRLNECPLGSGAVAGATLALDRMLVSQQLEFDRPTLNSIDATGDRDFAIEFVNGLSLLAIHLSRWAEEFILFATQEYGFIQLPEAYSTGSSAMPQKQNPDALELIRGKAARILGNQVALLAVVKGLPLAYNKDMQETQEPLFEAASTVRCSLEIATGFMRLVEFNCNRMRCACEHGFMNALAAATYLVKHDVPFRQAHEMVAHAVQKCVEKKCELQGLSLQEFQEFSPAFGEDIYDHLTVEAVLACHDVPGGTAPRRVQQALKAARQTLTALQETESAYA